MTIEEYTKISEGIDKWAEMAFKEDWVNEHRWWTRLANWYNERFRGLYSAWYDSDELASSIKSYAGLFDDKVIK